jgi:hypothetical protein
MKFFSYYQRYHVILIADCVLISQVVYGHNYCGPRGCSKVQKSAGTCRGLGYQPWLETKMQAALVPGQSIVRVMLVAEPASRLVSSYFYRQAQAMQQQHATQNVQSSSAKPKRVNASMAARHVFSRVSPFDEADLVRYANETFAVDRDAAQWHWLADGALPGGTIDDVLAHVLPRFDVVGLTHRFDETLVLLRRALALPPTPRALLHVRLKDSAVAPAAATTAGSGRTHPKLADLQSSTQAAVQLTVDRNGDIRFFVAAQKRFQAALNAADSNTESILGQPLLIMQQLCNQCVCLLQLSWPTSRSHKRL